MSFGYGVGDILTTIKLINAIYVRFAEAPAQYKTLSDE
jgi:hypothetical protein